MNDKPKAMNRDDALKLGDVVRLKSGGPKMTVTRAQSLPFHVECAWFSFGFAYRETFPADALTREPVDAESPKQGGEEVSKNK